MYRLLLLALFLFWSAVQAFIGTEAPSDEKRIQYSMVNTYGIQAVSMNPRRVILGATLGSTSQAFVGKPDEALSTFKDTDTENTSSAEVANKDIQTNNESYAPSSKLQTRKNTPAITAANLDTIAEQQRVQEHVQAHVKLQQESQIIQVDAQNLPQQNLDAAENTGITGVSTLSTRIVTAKHLDDLRTSVDSNPSEAQAITEAKTVREAKNSEVVSRAYGFGLQANSVLERLEDAQEAVSNELAQSEVSAKAHSNVALRVPADLSADLPTDLSTDLSTETIQASSVQTSSVQTEIAISEVVDTSDANFSTTDSSNTDSSNTDSSNTDSTNIKENFTIVQEPTLEFEARSMPISIGGFAQFEDEDGAGQSQDASNEQKSFKVGLTSVPTTSAVLSNRRIVSGQGLTDNQRIADNLTVTTTTVVSGLEITLNPNDAVRREASVEQQAFLWPLPTKGRLTSGYGRRVLAITNNDFHRGMDIAVKSGTPILAVKDGVVETAGWEGNYGYAVYLRHNDGTETRYAHMSRVIVEKGEWVNQGQWLGLVGNTGLSTGPHLHFELHLSGKAVDPSKHLVFTGERIATR